METILDLAAVRRFTDTLREDLRRCDHGEGTECLTLEGVIGYYVNRCAALHERIRAWVRAVFSGRITFDPESEALLQTSARQLLASAKEIAAYGRAKDDVCGELEGLSHLHSYVAKFDYLLDNWVSPRLAVGPAARVEIPNEAAREIRERLTKLAPLPADWLPGDLGQTAQK